MIIHVNGADREVPVDCTVAGLIEALGFGRRQVVVELNGEPLERTRYDETVLAEADRIEIVRAVAGG